MIARLRFIWKNLFVYAWTHPWARQDRLGTFARIVRWQAIGLFSRATRAEPWIGEARLAVAPRMWGATGNIYYGLHEFADMALFAHLLRPGDLFADVGANAGSYTVLAAKVCRADVIAFEPAAETIGHLRENVRLNQIGSHVDIRQIALSDSDGMAELTSGLGVSNSLVPADGAAAQAVETGTADGQLAGRGLVAMKVDVEGAEDRVFSQSRTLLAEPQLLAIEIETVTPAVERAVRESGFVRRYYDPYSRTLSVDPGPVVAGNQLWVRDDERIAARLRSAPRLSYRGLTI